MSLLLDEQIDLMESIAKHNKIHSELEGEESIGMLTLTSHVIDHSVTKLNYTGTAKQQANNCGTSAAETSKIAMFYLNKPPMMLLVQVENDFYSSSKVNQNTIKISIYHQITLFALF